MSLKIQLEEAKRTDEVMKMRKKEEYCEKLEEEVVSFRVKVDKLNKNLNNSPVLNKTGFGCISETTYQEHANHNKNVEENKSPTREVFQVARKE